MCETIDRQVKSEQLAGTSKLGQSMALKYIIQYDADVKCIEQLAVKCVGRTVFQGNVANDNGGFSKKRIQFIQLGYFYVPEP